MRLLTFQPKTVLDTINGEAGCYTATREDTCFKGNIFCIKADKTAMENIFITAPSMPQVLIEFEVDDSEVDVIDYIEWVNYINNHRRAYTGKYANVTKYKEYVVSAIRRENVIHTEVVSDSNDADKVQDMFMDKHFERYEKLSGKKWKRNRDLDSSGFWETYEAFEFVTKVTQCMMPRETLTEKDVDAAHRLIRETYLVS